MVPTLALSIAGGRELYASYSHFECSNATPASYVHAMPSLKRGARNAITLDPSNLYPFSFLEY